jgi:xylulokinase
VALYLGFDCSTQSLSAIVIEVHGDRRRVVFQHSLNFDRDFPVYGTTAGVRRGEDPREVFSSPLMWADALDRMMETIATAADVDIAQIRAISGSAQQHGSVYLNRHAPHAWRSFDHTRPLAPQLAGSFSRQNSPVWMDDSTTEDCEAIDRALGGPEATAALTGSRAHERFTGPQIRKFHRVNRGAYAATMRIHLVSSFMASLLAGSDAPVEPGDGSGMNLMDLRTADWSPAALDATAPGLRMRLPDIRPSWTSIGKLAAYWRHRYSFPAAAIVAWTGDNPSSLIGTGTISEGRLAVSLGTSDTVFACTREPRPGASHVFGSPTGEFMSLVCFRNGSLAREFIRAEHGLDWPAFSRLLESTAAGNGGAFMLPWVEAEITPRVQHHGLRRFGFVPGNPALDVRAIVEGQMMAMANHSAGIAGRHLTRVVATGGGSINRAMLQVMADVFGADVHPLDTGNSACLGAALRAFHADRLDGETPVSWHEVVRGFTDPEKDDRVSPIAAHVPIYAELRKRYADAEALHKDRERVG